MKRSKKSSMRLQTPADKNRRPMYSRRVRIKSPAQGAIEITEAFLTDAHIEKAIAFTGLWNTVLINMFKRLTLRSGQRAWQTLPKPIYLKNGDVLRVLKGGAFLGHFFCFLGNKYIIYLPKRRVQWVSDHTPITEFPNTFSDRAKKHYSF